MLEFLDKEFNVTFLVLILLKQERKDLKEKWL